MISDIYTSCKQNRSPFRPFALDITSSGYPPFSVIFRHEALPQIIETIKVRKSLVDVRLLSSDSTNPLCWNGPRAIPDDRMRHPSNSIESQQSLEY